MAATATVQPHVIPINQHNDKPNFAKHCNVEPKPKVKHVGNYIIYEKTIGAGSMGTVKLAERLSDKDHKLYAVKIMPKVDLDAEVVTKTHDPKDTPREREQRTIREMAIMRLLHHPNICKLEEWIVQGDQYYMFLEYIQGGQLLDYILQYGRVKEEIARKFARQIVSALDYCHRNSIVHRDLKIENILLTNEGEIKIIDFGLSNIYSPNRLLDTFCGSLYYAAPELLRAKYYTGPEVDVWSFGIVLYVLVCGRVPFDDRNLPTLHQKIKAGHVEYPDHLSKECADLLSKILVVDPLKRASLSSVIHHPWLDKGHNEPINNHLPYRQPLTAIDSQVIQGMQGFGLGTFEAIEQKLLHLIFSPEYQHAAAKVDKNYQKKHNASNDTKWHRNLSIRRPNTYSQNDDPQTLPAMYDPLISIYYLVKERNEFDAKQMRLAGQGQSVRVGRSVSTSLTKPSLDTNPQLQRRKSERVPTSHYRPPIQENREQLERKSGVQAQSRMKSVDGKKDTQYRPPLQERRGQLEKRTTQSGIKSGDRETDIKPRSPNVTLGGRFIEEGLEEKVSTVHRPSTQPKSLFNFIKR